MAVPFKYEKNMKGATRPRYGLNYAGNGPQSATLNGNNGRSGEMIITDLPRRIDL
jgi:hypothetical protein